MGDQHEDLTGRIDRIFLESTSRTDKVATPEAEARRQIFQDFNRPGAAAAKFIRSGRIRHLQERP